MCEKSVCTSYEYIIFRSLNFAVSKSKKKNTLIQRMLSELSIVQLLNIIYDKIQIEIKTRDIERRQIENERKNGFQTSGLWHYSKVRIVYIFKHL